MSLHASRRCAQACSLQPTTGTKPLPDANPSGYELSGRYVTRKDPSTNVVYLSRRYYEGDKVRNTFGVAGFNWIGGVPIAPDRPLLCKVRHGPGMYSCQLEVRRRGSGAVLARGVGVWVGGGGAAADGSVCECMRAGEVSFCCCQARVAQLLGAGAARLSTGAGKTAACCFGPGPPGRT